MRVLVTGSRNWKYQPVIEAAFLNQVVSKHPDSVTVIHGDCPTGADALADKIARDLHFDVIKYPANWSKYGKWAGPKRNIEMVENEHPDICLAFPLGVSKGTRHCMKVAKEAGIPVINYGDE